ncbi:MAG: winged helix-turn-helix domain-containing protein [Chloroflexota bacterium]|nr:MAG: winged helix-turn-helix domain-containing protein [Chloroflexota bacterium]
MSIDNPFFHRGAIRRADEFHGRQAEIAQILGLCRNGQSVSIVGPRRIGKSSLLLHLSRPSTRAAYDLGQDRALFAMVDCQELGGSPPEEVYEALLTSITDAALSTPLKLEDVRRPGTYRALDRVLNTVYRANVSVVVLFDEFELLAANSRLTPYFFARLRGLTTKYGLAYLTASQRPLIAISADEQILSSPFFNIFVSLSLGLFTEDEASSLIARRLRDTGVTFSPNLRAWIFELAGYHPCFLHIAGYHAFQEVSSDQFDPATPISSWLDAPVEVEAESHFTYVWRTLTPEEQYGLAILDGAIETMRHLEQQCLLIRADGDHQYSSDLLRRFVRRQAVNDLIQAGPFVIDLQRHQVQAEGEEVALTASQFDLLTRLTQQPGQVVPSAQLEIAVWGDALVDDPDRLKTLIKRLRRAIEPFGSWIVSERGVGYAMREPGA